MYNSMKIFLNKQKIVLKEYEINIFQIDLYLDKSISVEQLLNI